MAGGGGGEVNKEEMISIQDQRGEGHAAVANSNSAHMVHVHWQHKGEACIFCVHVAQMSLNRVVFGSLTRPLYLKGESTWLGELAHQLLKKCGLHCVKWFESESCDFCQFRCLTLGRFANQSGRCFTWSGSL